MKISYAITVCNELNELQELVSFLSKEIRQEDEIVILYDTKNGSKGVDEFLRAKSVNTSNFRWHGRKFDGHFADHKNYLSSICEGDYIFQIDADEIPSKNLLTYLPHILQSNNVDALRVPRVNTVKGLTQEHIQKWNWIVDSRGRVNWPDPQWRIYKNNGKIQWKNKVHEVLEGYNTHSILPLEEEFALNHHKEITRQEKQNKLYESL